MRLLALFACLSYASAALFGGDDSSASSSAASSPSASVPAPAAGTNGTGGNSPEVAFLLTLQAAQISSMNCLITLVNMTQQNIGRCLNLPALAPLVIEPSKNSSFSAQLSTYLGATCSQTCADKDIAEAQSQLTASCASQSGTGLITVLRAVLSKYTSSYRTLACQVHFNGTTPLCLPSVFNTSQAANNNAFFNDLVSGTNLDQYQQSVFQQAECTGCTYELFKAAQYTLPPIRGQPLTNALGSHLENECQGTLPNWKDVQDQEIPPSLQVQQSTGVASAAARVVISRYRTVPTFMAAVGLLIGVIL